MRFSSPDQLNILVHHHVITERSHQITKAWTISLSFAYRGHIPLVTSVYLTPFIIMVYLDTRWTVVIAPRVLELAGPFVDDEHGLVTHHNYVIHFLSSVLVLVIDHVKGLFTNVTDPFRLDLVALTGHAVEHAE